MSKSLIIFAVLISFSLQRISSISNEELQRLTPGRLEAKACRVAIAKAFADFYSKSFQSPLNIQDNLRAMSAEDREALFKSLPTPVTTEDQLVASAKAAAEKHLHAITKGQFGAFTEQLEADLLSLVRTWFKADLKADKTPLLSLLNRVIDEVTATLDHLLAGSNEAGIFHAKTGEDYDNLRWFIITRLRRIHIQTLMEKGLLIVSVYTDPNQTITSALADHLAYLFDDHVVNAISEDVPEEFDDFVQEFVAPKVVAMLAKKDFSDFYAQYEWVNWRVTNLVLRHQMRHQIIIYKRILGSSLTAPGQSLETAEHGVDFKRFLVSRFEAMPWKLPQNELRNFGFDYLACKPEALGNWVFNWDQSSNIVKAAGNVNNFLFFLKFFRYYLDGPDAEKEQAREVGEVFDVLYRILLAQRAEGEKLHFSSNDWVKYIKNDFNVYAPKDAQLRKFVPIVNILTALVLDGEFEYNAEEFKDFDPKDQYFAAVSANDDFLLDYKRFKGKGHFPKTNSGTINSVIIPEVGVLTPEEHHVLSHPDSIKIIKDRLAEGKKVVKMTELNPRFESDEEVLVYILVREESAPKSSW